MIGEVGVNGQPLGERGRTCLVTPAEERGLRAAARASIATGVPIVIHQPNVPEAVTALTGILESEGLDPGMVCLGHMSSVLDLELHATMIARGYWIAYDNFGMNVANRYITHATDERRVAWLLQLLRRDLGHHILISHDVWSKIQLAHYGGGGYTHLHDTILPWLRREGVGEEQIDQLTILNPAAFFARSEGAR